MVDNLYLLGRPPSVISTSSLTQEWSILGGFVVNPDKEQDIRVKVELVAVTLEYDTASNQKKTFNKFTGHTKLNDNNANYALTTMKVPSGDNCLPVDCRTK